MSQKTASKRLKKKKIIAEKAIALLAERGSGFTLGDVAAALNMGRTTIYEYFKDKEEILGFYLEEEMDRYHGEALTALSGEPDWRLKIYALLKIQLKYAPSHRTLRSIFQTLQASSSPSAKPLLPLIRQKHLQIYNELAQIIAQGTRQGVIRDVPPALFSEFILNSTSIPFTNVPAGGEELATHLLSFLLEGVLIKEGC